MLRHRPSLSRPRRGTLLEGTAAEQHAAASDYFELDAYLSGGQTKRRRRRVELVLWIAGMDLHITAEVEVGVRLSERQG